MFPLDRRRFLQLSAASLLVAPLARAIEPLARAGQPRMMLGLAAYSFRDSFKEMRGKPNPKGTMDMFGFIDFCAEQGVAAELTSYFFPVDVTPEYLLKVRRHAFLRGVPISGTSVGNNFALPAGPQRDKEIADVKKWIEYAAILGAPHIRIFSGAAPKGMAEAEARERCIAAIEECCALAGQKGIFLGLENHGGLVARAEAMVEIVKAVKSPWFGVNLDSGNFHSEDPYAELAQIAPYSVNVQVKAEIKRAGAKEPERSDLAKLVSILRQANYQGYVTLEHETKEDPVTAVPPLLKELRELLAAPAAATGAAWTPLFDGQTLAGWKEAKFSGQGEVKIEDGKLVLGMGSDITGVNYAGKIPTMNFEVAFEAMRVQGSDFFVGFTFPYGDAHCTFVAGGWGGGLVGLSSINGDDASENETMQAMKFDTGRWYRFRVRVTPQKIEGWIDADQVLNVETTDKKISMRPGEIELSIPFGLATFRTEAAYRDIKLRPL